MNLLFITIVNAEENILYVLNSWLKLQLKHLQHGIHSEIHSLNWKSGTHIPRNFPSSYITKKDHHNLRAILQFLFFRIEVQSAVHEDTDLYKHKLLFPVVMMHM